jgi:hypothetical protein
MKNSKSMITMKALYILTAIIGLQINMLVAGNVTSGSTLTSNEITLTDLVALVPATPKEADFSDVAPESDNSFKELAPILPSEADFSDTEVVPASNLNLAPVTPVVADFEDLV